MKEDIAAAYEAATQGAEAGPDTAAETAVEDNQAADTTTSPTESTDAPRLYTVKVAGGQEIEVSEDELISGYSRQSDYTRKTQELAAERERLEAAEAFWNALHEDPAAVLEAIQEHFAVGIDGESGEENPGDDRIAALESFVQQQQMEAIEARVSAEIERLQSEYGNFDGDELLEYAIENQIPNLEAAFLLRQTANERVKREQERREAKRNAPPVAGGSRAAGSQETPPKEINNIRDALEAAMADAGLASLDF